MDLNHKRKMKKFVFINLIIAIVVLAVGCSCESTFEQQRESAVEYLRTYNEVDNDLDDVVDSIITSLEPTLVPNLLQRHRTLEQFLSAYQGALHRVNELKAPTDETLAHIQAYKKWLQDMISAIQDIQLAISSGNQNTIAEAFSNLDYVGSQASSMNRLTESLMVKYNIPDAEVNYRFRGK
jgi:uncharacterized protein YoxC